MVNTPINMDCVVVIPMVNPVYLPIWQSVEAPRTIPTYTQLLGEAAKEAKKTDLYSKMAGTCL